jgi:glycosyltransferase involved in cell wall biosynthesis
MSVLERLNWEQFELSAMARRDKIDVLHSPGFASPLLVSCRVIVTVHDLIGMVFPGNLAPLARFYWSRWLPFAVGKADRVIVDSEHTKKDVIRLLGVKPDRIKVVYLGVSDEFRPIADRGKILNILSKYNIKGEYILHVGTLEPRKNLERLVTAFDTLKRTHHVPHKLVLVGSKEWAYPNLLKLINKLDIAKDIMFTGYMEERDLPVVYNGADIFVFPSLYEGFGLPLIEAMACGVCVVTSNTSSMPEIAGEAAVMVDPYDTAALAGAVYDLISSKEKKALLREKGFIQAKKFNWENTAREILSEYIS